MNTTIDLTRQNKHPIRKWLSKRHGFTLVELLVVAIVAAILMGLVVAALAGAQQDAYVAKTRATIRKIDTIIQDKYEAYRYDALDFVLHTANPGTIDISANTIAQGSIYPSTKLSNYTINSSLGALVTGVDSILQTRIRLALLRDKMRLDMPDCYGDLLDIHNSKLMTVTDINTGYLYGGSLVVYARLNYGKSTSTSASFSPVLSTISLRAKDFTTFQETNLNAELLFLAVENTSVNGSVGIESFASSEIGDTDGDGLRELIDAWGNPIQWLRSPAGYSDDDKQSQKFDPRSSGSMIGTNRYDPDPFFTAAAEGANPPLYLHRDEFDPTLVDIGYALSNSLSSKGPLPGGALRPLIVSGGQDGITALRFFWTGPNKRNAGVVGLTHLFSVSRSEWGLNDNYYWPDPYHPRQGTTDGTDSIPDPDTNLPLNLSLGGVLNYTVDQPDSTGFKIIKGFSSTGGLIYDDAQTLTGSATEVNAALLEAAADNIANFDETGGSI